MNSTENLNKLEMRSYLTKPREEEVGASEFEPYGTMEESTEPEGG
jgi:hypothetical protein